MLDTAIRAARAAEAVIRRYYREGFDVTLKADASPVTQADVESERTIKTVIAEAFPDHGFFGEETGRERIDAEYLWLIDPIDGTKSFVRRYPFFSTQIALMHRGELVLGVSNAPEFNEMAWAERGQGAFLNGQPIRVSEIVQPAEATLSLGNLKTLAAGSGWAGLGTLVGQVNRTRGYGDFYHYHLLASGRIDVVLESDVNILDIAALATIVREAGGVFTDMHGAELGLDTTSVLAAATPALHASVRRVLGV
ncbi:MAG: inositol-phosphate phosphatase [Chromatiales bacterium]|jgi:histidinol-phosphatase|nr:inositol-phosphate phosphatase [Chromatiales bacterium]MDX9766849.1 inositol monophosphatase family protein [Ectothiorhodospiraceae bacterium]